MPIIFQPTRRKVSRNVFPGVCLATVLTIISSGQSAYSQPASTTAAAQPGDNATQAPPLLSETSTQADFDNTARYLSQNAGKADISDLEDNFRTFYNDSKTQPLALSSLSRFSVSAFDRDLALSVTTNISSPNIQYFLSAVANSGGLYSEGALESLAIDNTHNTFISPDLDASFDGFSKENSSYSTIRPLLWRSWMSLAPPAISGALAFYLLNDTGRKELEDTPDPSVMLSGALAWISQTPPRFGRTGADFSRIWRTTSAV